MDGTSQERYICEEVCSRRHEVALQLQGTCIPIPSEEEVLYSQRLDTIHYLCTTYSSFESYIFVFYLKQFIEIHEKFKLIKRNHLVIDLGAAPGGKYLPYLHSTV